MFNCISLLIKILPDIKSPDILKRFVFTGVWGMVCLGYATESKAFRHFPLQDTIQAPVDSIKKATRFSRSISASDTSTVIRDNPTGTSGRMTETVADSSIAGTDTIKEEKIKPPYVHQIRVGVDLARLGFNFMFPSRVGFEFQGDYALRNPTLYLAAEAGYGRGNIDYSFLKYTTHSTFVRVGIEKSFLDKVSERDLDIGFLGFRYGVATGSYSDAEFRVESPFGGTREGMEPGRSFFIHWGEIIGGIKVEVWNGIFLGWTVRGKFLFNPKQFPSISPNYIAGYGKGDRTSIFDFNFYLSYGFKWKK